MTTIKKFRGERCYAKISNQLLQNSKLSFKARGLMAYILSLPDNWELCAEHLWTCSEQDGRTAVQSAMRELVLLGYIHLETIRDEATGRICDRKYIAYDDPSENVHIARKPIAQESLKTGFLSLGEPTATKEIPETKEIQKQNAPDGAEVSLPFESLKFSAAWQDWLDHRRERRLPKLKPSSLKRQFKKLSAWGESAAIASIDASISQGWQGLFPPDPKARFNGKPAGTPVRAIPALPEPPNWQAIIDREFPGSSFASQHAAGGRKWAAMSPGDQSAVAGAVKPFLPTP